MHHHISHTTEPKITGSDMCMVENREVENFSELDQSFIVNRVWETCRPTGNIYPGEPTVSARKVKITRVHLDTSPRDCEGGDGEQAACDNVPEGTDNSREQRSILNTVRTLAAALIHPGHEDRHAEAEEGRNQSRRDRSGIANIENNVVGENVIEENIVDDEDILQNMPAENVCENNEQNIDN